ncbi:hypothetical protein D3C71_1441310 [compost metagenome]
MGCQQVGQLALAYLLEDMAGKRNYKVTVNRDDPRRRKAVVVNVEQEGGKLTNDVTRLRAHIALAPIQQTAAYKQQLAERMTQAMSQLPPEAAGACFDLLVELMDVPRKAEFVERIRNALNIPKDPDEMSDEERAGAEQQAQQAQMQQELAMREMQAKLAELEGKAAKWQAEAQRIAKLTDSIRFEDALKQAQTGKTLQEMERLAAEQQSIQGEQALLQAQLLDTIQQQIDVIAL